MGESKVVVMVVCGGGSVCVLMRFVWKVCVWGVGGWVSEFWRSGIV